MEVAGEDVRGEGVRGEGGPWPQSMYVVPHVTTLKKYPPSLWSHLSSSPMGVFVRDYISCVHVRM